MLRVISYASRSLTDVDWCYSQTEKEGLALLRACERFNMYGQSFELGTDHKPSERIYSHTSKTLCPNRVVYCPGKTNITNGLSHLHSFDQVDHGEDCSFVRPVAESCICIALWPRETEVKHFKSTHFPVCTSERQIMGLWWAITSQQNGCGSQASV